jgi:hypothetical protein
MQKECPQRLITTVVLGVEKKPEIPFRGVVEKFPINWVDKRTLTINRLK